MILAELIKSTSRLKPTGLARDRISDDALYILFHIAVNSVLIFFHIFAYEKEAFKLHSFIKKNQKSNLIGLHQVTLVR